MSYGFLATNNNNEVLVSSDTRNLHFLQKRTTPSSITYTTNFYGGMRHWNYNFTNVSVTPIPFFTTPTTDYYAITKVTNTSGNNWTVEVMRSGTSTSVPEVYLFADPRAGSPTDNYGMIVYKSDGTTSFDSRLKPLTVTGGQAVSHPTNPKSSYSSSGLTAKYCGSIQNYDTSVEYDISNFIPDQYNSYNISGQPSKPIFSYLSLAQAERELTLNASEEECDGVSDGYGGCIGFQRTYYWTSKYFAFYRGGIRWDAVNNNLRAGWIIAEKGCNWTYYRDNDFLGIGTGSDSGTGGNWPYSNETINTANNTVIIGNGAKYD